MRTQTQKIWDYVATLRLFEAVNEISHMRGNLKIQKLTFLAEFDGLQNHLSSFHLRFFRYTYGPYSRDLAKDIEFLTKQGFLATSRELTKKAEFLLEYVRPEIQQSQKAMKAFEILEKTAGEYGRKGGTSLMNLVYRLAVPVFELGGEPQKVESIDFMADIFVPTCTKDVEEVTPFSADLLKDIEQELALSPDVLDPQHPNYRKSVQAAYSRIEQAINA